MSEMIDRVAQAIFNTMDITDGLDGSAAERYARAAIEAMRPEFEAIADAYSPQGDDTVWIDDRTPIGQYVDSIINRVDA